MTEPNGPEGIPADPAPHTPGAVPATTPPVSMQPKYLVWLAIGATLVLIAGLVAVAVGSGGGHDPDRPVVAPTTTVTRDDTVQTTSRVPLPLTTPPTTDRSTTTTSSTTSTTLPAIAVADAGDDLVVSAGQPVTLTAVELTDEDQAIVWRQTAGPDVTDGAGRLRGNDASFVAPGTPTTLRFELAVTGRGGDVARDELRVDVLEQADGAVFVDGAAGDDDADGSRDRPFRTLARALAFTSGSDSDIYLRTYAGTYRTEGGVLNEGTGIYGGFDADWVRDPLAPAALVGPLAVARAPRAIVASVTIEGGDTTGVSTAYGLTANDVDELVIENSVIRSGRASVDSIGLLTEFVDRVVVVGSTVGAGRAGAGRSGSAGDGGRAAAAGGDAAEPPTAGVGADDAGDGGAGGEGEQDGQDGALDTGGSGGDPGDDASAADGGAGGDGGDGGRGGEGRGDGARGADGNEGAPGRRAVGGGGGGGGGGDREPAPDDDDDEEGRDLAGGGGGGGGAGGFGGTGGSGGQGGFGSVGAYLVGADDVVIRDSTIEGGAAGVGGSGGSGGPGGGGGAGGDGALGVETAGDGGGGGGGGAGGAGGDGGGGAGGWSVGLLTDRVAAVTVTDSALRSGAGGSGGGGGAPGLVGRAGEAGDGPRGGDGGSGTGDVAAVPGAPSSGGDSVAWWDTGDAVRTIERATIEPGPGGAPGGAGGRPGRSVRTLF